MRLIVQTGFAIRSRNDAYMPDEMSFNGDVASVGRPTGVYAIDFDSDDDQMRDEWERAFGLDATVADGALDPDGDGLTNLQEHEAGTHPRGVVQALFRGRRGERVLHDAAGDRQSGRPAGRRRVPVPRQRAARHRRSRRDRGANARSTLELTPLTDRCPENDFSTVIESDRPVVVDRTMTWDQHRAMAGTPKRRIAAPSTTWYLAEGATHGAFDLFYLLQNPNDARGERDGQLPAARAARAGRQDLHRSGRTAALTIPVDGEGPELEAAMSAARDHFRSADRRRARDVFDAAGPAGIRGGPRRRRRHRAGADAGSSRKARPATSSISTCWSRNPEYDGVRPQGDVSAPVGRAVREDLHRRRAATA